MPHEHCRWVRQLSERVFRSSVAWSMLVIVIRVLGFVAVMGVALRLLPRESIGLWYGMMSLAAVAAGVEFGFSATIARRAGYYWAGAGRVPALGLSGLEASPDGPNIGALEGLVIEARRVFRFLSALFLAVSIAMACGWIWMLPPAQRVTPELLAALGLLIAGGAVNLSGMFWTSLLTGLQKVRDAFAYLAAGFVTGYVITLLGLWLGTGLVAMAAGLVAQSMLARALARRQVLAWLRAQPAATPVRTNWRTFWPTTWRAGVAQAASYLLLPLMPLLVTTYSLKEAASFGLGLQATLMLETLASSWIAVKWPQFASLRAMRKLTEVRRIAGQRLALSMLTFVTCAAGVPMLAAAVFAQIGSRTPFVTNAVWAGLAVAGGIDLFVGAHCGLIQTGNRVSHLRAFIATGVINLCAAPLLAMSYGTAGVLASVIVSQLLINVWWLPRVAWRQLADLPAPEGTTP